jgi:uncharacterized protein
MKKWVLLWSCLCCLALPCLALETIPEPTGLVNDGAQILDDIPAIENKLRQIEKNSGVEMAIVTRKTMPNENLESYVTRLFNTWGIGKKHKNNGLLFFMALKEHKMRLEVGPGLKERISDSQAKSILDNQVRPRFKSGDFQGGVEAAIDQIESRIQPQNSNQPQKKNNQLLGWLSLLAVIAFITFVIRSLFRSIFKLARRTSQPFTGSPNISRVNHLRHLPTDDYTQATDSWRNNSYSSDSSSSFDSFGGGSSDGGGASSDW